MKRSRTESKDEGWDGVGGWGVGVRLKLDVQRQGGGRILDVDGQRGWRVLKIAHISWTSYGYHALW